MRLGDPALFSSSASPTVAVFGGAGVLVDTFGGGDIYVVAEEGQRNGYAMELDPGGLFRMHA